jgi:hypothetical protein
VALSGSEGTNGNAAAANAAAEANATAYPRLAMSAPATGGTQAAARNWPVFWTPSARPDQ